MACSIHHSLLGCDAHRRVRTCHEPISIRGFSENGGFEYNLVSPAVNQGGNKADNSAIPKTTAPPKCPTFPAAGTQCE
jgi:hypothetical protein